SSSVTVLSTQNSLGRQAAYSFANSAGRSFDMIRKAATPRVISLSGLTRSSHTASRSRNTVAASLFLVPFGLPALPMVLPRSNRIARFLERVIKREDRAVDRLKSDPLYFYYIIFRSIGAFLTEIRRSRCSHPLK